VCSNLLQDERRQIGPLSRRLRLLTWPHDRVLICGYKLVPCCEVVGVNLHLFHIVVVFSPRLVVVVQSGHFFLFHHIVLSHACLEVECGVVGAFLRPGLVLALVLLF
jgi:hypothetical protein